VSFRDNLRLDLGSLFLRWLAQTWSLMLIRSTTPATWPPPPNGEPARPGVFWSSTYAGALTTNRKYANL
jgi:hypothetical protein